MAELKQDRVWRARVQLDSVRWGMIGAGSVTEKKSAPGLQQAEGSELVAVMRRDAAKAADYAARHGVRKWYSDAAALIHDPEVDAVYIATPPSSHAEYTLRAAAAGKPVYVEKPMAPTAADCEVMNAACRAAGVPLFVAYYRRAMPRFKKIKELLESGAIGEPRTVTVQLERPALKIVPDPLPWRLEPDISGGGLFVDLGSHTLDFLDWLLGPVTDVRGLAANQGGQYRAEDLVAGAFGFASGVRGVGLWCFSGSQARDSVEIVGTGGSLSFSSFDESPLRLVSGGNVTEVAAPYPETVQAPLIQTVVDALTGRGSCPSTGDSALRTARVIDALLADYRARHLE